MTFYQLFTKHGNAGFHVNMLNEKEYLVNKPTTPITIIAEFNIILLSVEAFTSIQWKENTFQ